MTFFNVNALKQKYIHFLTDPTRDSDQFASNADSSYISGKRQKCDLLLKRRNHVPLYLLEICGFFLLTVTQNAFTSHVHLTLDTSVSQGDQQTNLLLIILRGKIHMIMI